MSINFVNNYNFQECDNIVGISVKFSTAKEDRFQMEQDINQITDAFQRILSGFLDVIQSWTDVVGNVRGAEVAPSGGEDPWPDQTTIEELREGLPDGYEVDYDFMEAVLKEAEDEEKWLENGYSDGDDTSSGCSDQEEEEERASFSRPTVDAEVHLEEDGIMQTERDDQPMLEKEKHNIQLAVPKTNVIICFASKNQECLYKNMPSFYYKI